MAGVVQSQVAPPAVSNAAATADEEDGTSQLSAVTPGLTDAPAGTRHLRSPSAGSSATGSLGSGADAQQPVALAARAHEMEAVMAAAKEHAFREQRHRHSASLSALRHEQANLERAKRELESCLIAARNQAALLQASQREESGEGAQCWDQAAAEVEARIAAAQAAAVAEYDAREAAARKEEAAQASEVRRAAQELAALRRAATLELQQLQAATGVTIGSCSACQLPTGADGDSSKGNGRPVVSSAASFQPPAPVTVTPSPILAALPASCPAPTQTAAVRPAAAAASAVQPVQPSPCRMQAVRAVAACRAAPPSWPAAPAVPGAAGNKLVQGELDAAEAGAESGSDDEAELWHDCASNLSRCSAPGQGQGQQRQRRGRGKGAPAGRACCAVM